MKACSQEHEICLLFHEELAELKATVKSYFFSIFKEYNRF